MPRYRAPCGSRRAVDRHVVAALREARVDLLAVTAHAALTVRHHQRPDDRDAQRVVPVAHACGRHASCAKFVQSARSSDGASSAALRDLVLVALHEPAPVLVVDRGLRDACRVARRLRGRPARTRRRGRGTRTCARARRRDPSRTARTGARAPARSGRTGSRCSSWLPYCPNRNAALADAAPERRVSLWSPTPDA